MMGLARSIQATRVASWGGETREPGTLRPGMRGAAMMGQIGGTWRTPSRVKGAMNEGTAQYGPGT